MQLRIIGDVVLPARGGKAKGTATDKRAGYAAAGYSEWEIAGVMAGLFFVRKPRIEKGAQQ